jgi:hypothetical protein
MPITPALDQLRQCLKMRSGDRWPRSRGRKYPVTQRDWRLAVALLVLHAVRDAVRGLTFELRAPSAIPGVLVAALLLFLARKGPPMLRDGLSVAIIAIGTAAMLKVHYRGGRLINIVDWLLDCSQRHCQHGSDD